MFFSSNVGTRLLSGGFTTYRESDDLNYFIQKQINKYVWDGFM